MDNFKNFDRNFSIMRKVVIGFMLFVALMMIGTFVFYGVVASKVISDPKGTAKEAGSLVKSFMDGVNGEE